MSPQMVNNHHFQNVTYSILIIFILTCSLGTSYTWFREIYVETLRKKKKLAFHILWDYLYSYTQFKNERIIISKTYSGL